MIQKLLRCLISGAQTWLHDASKESFIQIALEKQKEIPREKEQGVLCFGV
jgi:hypothetical protein